MPTSHNIIQRHWLPGLLLFTALITVLTTVRLAMDIGKPFGGYLTFHNVMANRLALVAENPTWWPGFVTGQLIPGDGLREIEGHWYENGAVEAEQFAEAAAKGLEFVTLRIVRSGESMLVQVPVTSFTWAHYIEWIAPYLLMSLSFLTIAFAVYRASPQQPSSKLLILFCTIVALYGASTRPTLYVHYGRFAQVVDLIHVIVTCLIGIVWIHFSLYYLRPSRLARPIVLYLLYAIGSGTAVIYIISRLMLWTNGHSDLVGTLDGYAFYTVWRLITLGVIVFLLRLIWLVLNQTLSRRERRETIILLFGLLIFAPSVYLFARVAFDIGTKEWMESATDMRFLYLAVPLAIALFILRYQTYGRIPRLLLVVPILALNGLLAHATAVFLFMTAPSLAIDYQVPPFLPVFLVTTAVSVLWITQSHWQGFFGRLFHWEQLNYQAVQQVGHQLLNHTNSHTMPTALAQTIHQHLNLEQTAVWIWQPEQATYQLQATAGAWQPNPPAQLYPPTATSQTTIPPIRLKGSTPDINTTDWLHPLQATNTQIAVPLYITGRPVGLLALGKRWDEGIFQAHDLDIINLIGQQAALFLLTAQQIETLRQIPQRITEAQERERGSISRELHDTVEQFLGALPYELATAWDHLENGQLAEATTRLQQLQTQAQLNGRTLFEIRNNLAPAGLRYGLANPLTHLIERSSQRTNIPITLQVPPTIDKQLLPEQQHALYRVIQQGLDNALAHAQATAIEVNIWPENGRLHFTIQDNGQGFTPTQQQNAAQNGSIGLQSMTARIKANGGQISWNSKLGAGTAVSGWLPV